MTVPPPPVPADADVRSMPFTPMYRARLFGSAFHAKVSDAGWRAGVTLWLKSWDQHPPGSLPEDDTELCRLAELGRDLKTWAKVKAEALWGWFKCSDGRLYHNVVAEGVNKAWADHKAYCERARKAREAKQSRRLSQGSDSSVTDTVTGLPTDHIITKHNITKSPQAPRDAGLSQTRRPTSTFGLKPIGSVPIPIEIGWPARLESWRRVKIWQADWGPAPDQPDCQAPAELLAALRPDPPAAAPAAPAADDLAEGLAWAADNLAAKPTEAA